MPEPKDKAIYATVKTKVYKNIPKHSAYRSGVLVKHYKSSFKRKYGNKNPYLGSYTKKTGLRRWFDEKWVNQRGRVGYKYKNDIYRPTKRITKQTPTTHTELSNDQIARARKEKYTKGRVRRFNISKTNGRKIKKNPLCSSVTRKHHKNVGRKHK